MCNERPCFSSVLGISLKAAVFDIGVIEFAITVIATTLNVIKYTQYVELFGDECESRDVCIGPLVKYTVFDAFFGVVCAGLLVVGSLQRSQCLLITWMIFTVLISLKYIWVVLTHDWTSLEVHSLTIYTFQHSLSLPGLDLHLLLVLHLPGVRRGLVLPEGDQHAEAP